MCANVEPEIPPPIIRQSYIVSSSVVAFRFVVVRILDGFIGAKDDTVLSVSSSSSSREVNIVVVFDSICNCKGNFYEFRLSRL